MLGQASSWMGVQALDDLGLPQRDVDRMKDWMTPKGRKRERARQALLSEGRKRRKRAQATATNKIKCHPPNLAPPPFGRS